MNVEAERSVLATVALLIGCFAAIPGAGAKSKKPARARPRFSQATCSACHQESPGAF